MASPVDTSVKFAHSSMAGAATVNGQAGSRLAALKAFLVTGFGLKSIDGAATIVGGKCRLPFSSGVSAAMVGSVIQVSGATPAGLNGEQKVTAVSTSWVEFATALPDGSVTGSISFKIASLGWEEVFSKTNVSVFRPTDPASSRPYLRVDDTNANYAALGMYESMTDVDTGFNATTDVFWAGYGLGGATGVHWTLAGDSRAFYFGVSPFGTAVNGADGYPEAVYFCGDIVSDRNGDAYPALLVGASTDTEGAVFTDVSSRCFLMRRASGIGLAIPTVIDSFFSGTSGYTSAMGSFPSPAANAMLLGPLHVADGGTFASNGRRGVMPGALFCPQDAVRASITRSPTLVEGTGTYSGKKLLTINVASSMNTTAGGMGFIDVTGPWRTPA
ncbi:hypothetical protein ACCQ08_24715 [Comamonas sp. SY3]|uniref:hypothetical protein n=1 Tax=Comamonas sp. SY3 TaxID=3243601 RepID=UPI0035940222